MLISHVQERTMTTLLEIVRTSTLLTTAGMIYAATHGLRISAIVVAETDGRTMQYYCERLPSSYLISLCSFAREIPGMVWRWQPDESLPGERWLDCLNTPINDA